MNQINIFDIFSLFCGLSIFLYGMQQGEKNLQRFGSSTIKKLITAVTKNRFVAFLTGLLVTVTTQSSSATTVMLVGLASANLLTLNQSLGIILGSDVGTTFTVQLFAFKFHEIAPLFIAIGFLMTFQKPTTRIYKYGKLILAFGFVFFGMKMMSESVAFLRELEIVREFIAMSLNNPFMGLVVATIFTAIIQSSAATLAILIVLVQSQVSATGYAPGIASYIPLVLGANLGTCITAFLASINAKAEGLRVAWAHFLFKTIGMLIFFPLIKPIGYLLRNTHFEVAFNIAAIHTVYNIILVLISLPFLKLIASFIEKIVPKEPQKNEEYTLHFIRESQLQMPMLALTQAEKEICRIFKTLDGMINQSLHLIKTYNSENRQKIIDMDDKVDFIHESVIKYLAKLSQEELDPESSSKAYQLIMLTTDLEHIGDIISKSISVYARKINDSNKQFPESDRRHIIDFYSDVKNRLQELATAFRDADIEKIKKIFDSKYDVRAEFQKYYDHQIIGLYEKHSISMQTTSIYIDLLEEIQRVNSFIFRLSGHLLEIHRID